MNSFKSRSRKNAFWLIAKVRNALAQILAVTIAFQSLMPISAAAATPERSDSNRIAALQSGDTATVYGPRKFERAQGQPVSVVEQFSLPSNAVPPYTILVQNGAPGGSGRASSATIKLNGADLFAQKDFNQNVESLTKQVTLVGNNSIDVKLSSAVGSFLTITITSALSSIDSITPNRAVQGQTLTVVLRGRNTNWIAGQTRVAMGGEVSVGGASFGELGPVQVTDPTTATAQVVVSASAALAPRLVRVVTPQAGQSRDEIETLIDGFAVSAVSPPGSQTATVSTYAGAAASAGFADGPASLARFNEPSAIAAGPDDVVYVADTGNHRIRKAAVDGTVSTVAGDGTAGFADGAGSQARFDNPQGVAVDSNGTLYVADTGNNRIRRISLDGTVTTIAGDGTAGFADGTGTQSRFNAPRSAAVDALGNVYVADTGNAAVRRIAPNGEVRTLAGDGTIGSNDSPNARFDGIAGVAVDGDSVYVYIADAGSHRIRRLDSSGTVITITGAERGFADGSASQARFAEPSGIAIDGSGRLAVTDTTNSLVREVDPQLAQSGSATAVRTIAGTGERGAVDGAGNAAQFNTPRGVAVLKSSAIIVADTGNHTLRRILLPPIITFINPSKSPIGTEVIINGERFDGRSPERNIVRFAKAGGGETAAVVTAATRSQLAVIAPSDAATGRVSVQTEGGTAISPTDFEKAIPSITDFNPKTGPVGTSVAITGSLLKANSGQTTVTFAGENGTRIDAAVTSNTDAEVQTTVPNGAITGTIEVVNAFGRATTAEPFTVTPSQDFAITVTPTSAQAVQNSSAVYMVMMTSNTPNFTAMASLAAVGLPSGIRTTFNPAQIAAGSSSTLTVDLNNSGTAPGTISFKVTASVTIEGSDLVREAMLSLTVLPGGQTTLSGRVLSTEDEPILGVTVSLDGRTATTDSAGAFLLTGALAGVNRAVMVDGRTASAPGRTYPVIAEPVTIVADQANTVPYTFYLPTIDTQFEVQIIPGQEAVVTTPRVEGLKTTIPAGANLRNRDGSPVTRVSMTPVPIDRTPAPLPADVTTAMVYTNQPGGAVSDVAMPVVYPNLNGADPGVRVELYNFNHDTVEWEIYGFGRVSADGRTIEPETDPATGKPYGLRDFSWHFFSPPPPPRPITSPSGNTSPNEQCCKSTRTCNTVDLTTGIKIETTTDFAFGGARGGLSLTRTYTTALALRNVIGRFGRGTKDNYEITLVGTFQSGGAGRAVWTEQGTGRLFSFVRTESDGGMIFATTEDNGQLGDVIRRLSNGTLEYKYKTGESMQFDSTGRLLSMTDRNNNTTTLTYSGNNLTRVTDPVGRSITFDYDGQGRVIRATDPISRSWQYAFDSLGMLKAVTDPLGKTIQYSYDGSGKLVQIIDKRNNLIKRIEYSNDIVTKQTFADGGSEVYDYTLSGTTITSVAITDSLGRRTIKRFNPARYLIEEIDELGQRTTIKRDITNNLPLETTGHCGCVESIKEFDARGNVVKMTNELNQVMRMEYEPVFNKLVKSIDRLGRETTYAYDSRGNLISMTNALLETTRWTYDEFGQMTSMTDALNHTWTMEYDAQGNLIAKTDPLSNRSSMEYDGIGRMTAMNDPLSRRTSMTYDALSRVVTSTDPANATTTFVYDPNDNPISMTDALNRTWNMEYDQKDRMTKRIYPLSSGETTRREMVMEYDTDDELITAISPSGRTTRYTYDPRGQRLTMTDPEGGIVRYSYDKDRNLLTLSDQRENTTTFVYDVLDRVKNMIDPLGRTSTMSYDAENNMTAMVDRLGRNISTTYDVLNRPSRIQYADAVVTYAYDAAGRRTRIDDTQSGFIAWTYDDANRMLTETTPEGVVSYSYNQASERTSMTAADRPAVNYTYDVAGRPSTISQNLGQGLETFTYGYDILSRRTSLLRPNGVTTAYSYDEVNRLTQLKHQKGTDPAVEDFAYSYNPDDEIASINSIFSAPKLPTEKTVSPADANNRIPSFGGANFAFNNVGETISKTDASGTAQYQWDARGRLTQVTLPGGQVVSYAYDALNRRKSRTTGGITTTFLYDGLDVVLDKGSDGSSVDYLNGDGIDQKLRQSTTSTGPLYFIQDHLGSTVALTSATSSVSERIQYEAFGESANSILTRYSYTGRERELFTGLIYYRNRWFDPHQGRFVSEDPIGYAGGMNFYEYARNNPTTFSDPFGLRGQCIDWLYVRSWDMTICTLYAGDDPGLLQPGPTPIDIQQPPLPPTGGGTTTSRPPSPPPIPPPGSTADRVRWLRAYPQHKRKNPCPPGTCCVPPEPSPAGPGIRG